MYSTPAADRFVISLNFRFLSEGSTGSVVQNIHIAAKFLIQKWVTAIVLIALVQMFETRYQSCNPSWLSWLGSLHLSTKRSCLPQTRTNYRWKSQIFSPCIASADGGIEYKEHFTTWYLLCTYGNTKFVRTRIKLWWEKKSWLKGLNNSQLESETSIQWNWRHREYSFQRSVTSPVFLVERRR